MTPGIQCESCRTVNPFGRMHCVRCGSVLRFPKHPNAGRMEGIRVGRWLRSILLLLVLAALIQMLRPMAVKGQLGGAEDSARLALRLDRLAGAVRAGKPLQEELSEAEVNGYLQAALDRTPKRTSSEWVRRDLEDVRVQFLPGEVAVVWSARWGALALRYEVVGIPRIRSGGFEFEVDRVRAGHLPLPGAPGRWAARRLATVFDGMSRERALLNAVAELEVGAGLVYVRTGEAR